jgi:4-amino-4-deoxy-L-arabinose transferase-like glycosyltransferase
MHDIPRERKAMHQRAESRRFRWYHVLALLAMTAVAAMLRLWAVGWGLPYVDHPDEPEVARPIFRMVQHGTWNPYFFDYPSLYIYALRLVFDACWRYEHAIGAYVTLTQVPPKYSLTPMSIYLTAPGFFLWGRFLTALVGTLTVLFVGVIGWRWWNAWVGLAAAAVLAVLPFHVRHSQFITVDVATAFTALLALGAVLRVLRHARLRDYALAGCAAGVAASTKYNAGAVGIVLILPHIFHWGRGSVRQCWRLPWAGLWAALGFVLFTPYAVLAPDELQQGLRVQYRDYATGRHGDALGRWPIGSYLHFFWTLGLGPLVALAALVGIAVILLRRDRAGLVVLAFVALHVGLLLNWPQHFWRNLMPVIPPLALCAGIGIVTAAAGLAALVRRVCRLPLESRAVALVSSVSVLVLTAGVLSMPFADSITMDQFNATTDARMRAADYMRNDLPPNAKIAAELNPTQWIGSSAVTTVPSLTEHPAAWYRSHGFQYLVANARYRTPADESAYAALRQQTTLVCAFDDQPPASLNNLVLKLSRTHVGPFSNARIEILDLDPSHAASSLQAAPSCDS